MLIRTIVFFSVVLTPLTTVLAIPSITSVQGQIAPGRAVVIQGAGFDVKEPAAPYLWADFENGIEPSPLGIKRSWDQIQRIRSSANGFAGSKGIEASDDSGVWTLRSDYDYWTRDNGKMYLFRRQKMNFKITSTSQNWKMWRLWPTGNGYPNVYAATNNGRVFVEKIGTESGFWGSFNPGTTNWYPEELIMKASSQINVKDGLLVIRQGGVEKARGSLLTRSSSEPAYMSWNYVMHGVGANFSTWSPAWSSGNRMWADDIYLDTTWARVMLGDASTYTACREFEPQIPTIWSPSSITVQSRAGVFAGRSTVYLYVFDKNGNVNSTGFPVSLNGTVPPIVNAAPVVNAGGDQDLLWTSSVRLTAAVSDDGLPTPAAITHRWSLLTGPASATIATPNSLSSTVQLTVHGTYVFRLTASDSQLQASDDVTIRLAAPIVVVPPTPVPSPTPENPSTENPRIPDVEPDVPVSAAIPSKNIFNPTRGEQARIVYEFSPHGTASMTIFDRWGQSVRSLSESRQEAGLETVLWDGRNQEGSTVASGVYVAVIRRPDGRLSKKKIVVLK